MERPERSCSEEWGCDTGKQLHNERVEPSGRRGLTCGIVTLIDEDALRGLKPIGVGRMLYGESDWEKNTTSAASRSIGLLKSAASVTLVSTLRTSKQKVGWDGKPRPKELRRKVDPDNWPDLLEPLSGTYTGEAFTWA